MGHQYLSSSLDQPTNARSHMDKGHQPAVRIVEALPLDLAPRRYTGRR